MLKKLMLISLIIILTFVSWYLYNNYFIIYSANNHIDVKGVKLLQKLEDVRGATGEQGEELVIGKRYRFSGLQIGIGRVGPIKGRVWHITTEDPKDSIYGVRVGDKYKDAIEKIKHAGFIEKQGHFFKGCIDIYVLEQGDIISEVNVRAWDRLAFKYFMKVNID